MLEVEIDEVNGVAILEPHGSLSARDFESAARIVDPYIEKSGSLKGLVIHAENFPGWDSFAALVSHLKFVKAHHTKISRVAFATDSVAGNFAETIGAHFVSAEIKVFAYGELEQARAWVAA